MSVEADFSSNNFVPGLKKKLKNYRATTNIHMINFLFRKKY